MLSKEGSLVANLVSAAASAPAQASPMQKVLIKGLSGALGAGVSAIALFPLENIKIRQMVEDSKEPGDSNGILGTTSKILRDEGIQGLYVGLAPFATYSIFSWGVFFLFYEFLK